MIPMLRQTKLIYNTPIDVQCKRFLRKTKLIYSISIDVQSNTKGRVNNWYSYYSFSVFDLRLVHLSINQKIMKGMFAANLPNSKYHISAYHYLCSTKQKQNNIQWRCSFRRLLWVQRLYRCSSVICQYYILSPFFL